MNNTRQSVQDGFDRFQRLLFALHAGDELRASDASLVCGLSEDTCRTVLEGLQRAGMMTHERGDRFVRKTLDLEAAQALGCGSGSPSAQAPE
jgi:DNA-binding IclR family transcriptional regulator